ncbi:hypothetical protein [Pedococcus sp. P5_B7]
MGEDMTSRVAAATWPARLAELATSAEALADDIALLAEQRQYPTDGTAAAVRRIATVARDLHLGASSLARFATAPSFESLVEQAALLHEASDRFGTRIATLAVEQDPPHPADALAASGLALQAEALRELIARRAVEHGHD